MNENKNVGILTLSASDNCGSLLQTYAMQQVLRKRYAPEAEVIDFRSEKARELYRIVPSKLLEHPRRTLHGILWYSRIRQEKEDYALFREQQLHMTKKVYLSEEELTADPPAFGSIITGSDQVWNLHMPDFDPAFFLNWAAPGMRKIAYAPSLGGTGLDVAEDPDSLRKSIRSFTGVSVRESFGQESVKELTGLEPPIVADPTLLLDRADWDALTPEPMVRGNYIFYYSWAYEDEKSNSIVSEYARKTGMPVYVINPSKWIRFSPSKFGFRLAERTGPMVFLNLMRYAKKVFVQSFHGIIFADIFQRDYLFLDEHSCNELVDKRIWGILQTLEKEDRIARSLDDIFQLEEVGAKESSYTRLSKLQQESFAYLDGLFAPEAEAALV